MKKLPARKIEQIRRVLADQSIHGRKDRLYTKAERKGQSIKSDVFHTQIAGKAVTIKAREHELTAKINSEKLFSRHQKAVKQGKIKPI
ncbi:MAG TPA: hypothetical protein VJG83_06445 [archaeon]|nr:hypothetical protein [archaeon]